MAETLSVDDNARDNPADDTIAACINMDAPASFFLFAGAGSGKTSSLVKALKLSRHNLGKRLQVKGQRIGVITYTNAARDEIKQRLNFDPLIEVSTIHSFVWSMICSFHADIRDWLKIELALQISEIEEQNKKGRPSKASQDRTKSIESKQKRLAALDSIRRFSYNPNGENNGRDSLNHSEVIKIGAYFLTQKPLLQSILVSKFPILLIDESQDTNRLLMEAFLSVQKANKCIFCLGLFGDMMQRIYPDGKMDLGQNLPDDWKKPTKVMNHRSPRRIVHLINRIRLAVDAKEQQPRSDAKEGIARLFIISADKGDKLGMEREVARRMAEITKDKKWTAVDPQTKCLILEHHMAARRMGFFEMFEPLYKVDALKTGALDGSLQELRLFSECVLPLLTAKRENNDFAIAAVIRKRSPLLDRITLKSSGPNQIQQIQKARDAVESLMALCTKSPGPLFQDVLNNLAETKLFIIPNSLIPLVNRKTIPEVAIQSDDAMHSDVITAWVTFLQTPFSQIESYAAYIGQKASFATHQGIKGLEFPRVMVVMDDTEARGFLFSYDRLFGIKGKTDADLRNEREGKETGFDRTRRLFYVTCSRAQESLALVAYSNNPRKVLNHVVSEGWFGTDEIELLA